MSRRWKAILLLLTLQAALSGTSAVVDAIGACGSCGARRLPLGAAGFLCYSALLALALMRGPGPLLFSGILAAFGVHAALAAQMLAEGPVCGLCLAAAAGSLGLTALSIADDRANLGRMALIVPWSALLVAVASGVSRPSSAGPPATTGSVRVLVYTDPGCPYCEELRDRVMPVIEREFGPRVHVEYRPSADQPAVRRTPTLVLSSGLPGTRNRVLEGLPTVERLRAAIRDLEVRS